jgi:hypothetical protein
MTILRQATIAVWQRPDNHYPSLPAKGKQPTPAAATPDGQLLTVGGRGVTALGANVSERQE